MMKNKINKKSKIIKKIVKKKIKNYKISILIHSLIIIIKNFKLAKKSK
jgi:hypothetical protein